MTFHTTNASAGRIGSKLIQGLASAFDSKSAANVASYFTAPVTLIGCAFAGKVNYQRDITAAGCNFITEDDGFGAPVDPWGWVAIGSNGQTVSELGTTRSLDGGTWLAGQTNTLPNLSTTSQTLTDPSIIRNYSHSTNNVNNGEVVDIAASIALGARDRKHYEVSFEVGGALVAIANCVVYTDSGATTYGVHVRWDEISAGIVATNGLAISVTTVSTGVFTLKASVASATNHLVYAHRTDGINGGLLR